MISKISGGIVIVGLLAGSATLVPEAIEQVEINADVPWDMARPAALISDDFDEDGVPDLVSGFHLPEGGVLTIHRGNVDAIYPNSPDAQRRRAEGSFTDSPFLTPARTFELPEPPSFLGTGDFDNDGHRDVVTAAVDDRGLYVLPGDGSGRLGPARHVALPGQVTAMISGEINRPDGLADLVVAVQEADRASLLVFEGPDGALRSEPEVQALPAKATDLVLGRLDGDSAIDLGVAVGRELLIVHGRDRRLPPDIKRVDRIAVPGTIEAIAVGDFFWESRHRKELGLLLDDGRLQVLGREDSPAQREAGEPQPWTKVLERRMAPGRRLLAARVSGLPTDDMIVLDASLPRLHVIKDETREEQSAELSSPPVAVLPMRLNGDALSDLVVIGDDGGGPTFMLSAAAATFTVDSTDDDKDLNPGDGVCTSGGPGCTLRAAIQEANALVGVDSIHFAIGIGPQTITPTSLLPLITEAVTIDGTTQPGFAGTPIIELNGTSAGVGIDGLYIFSGGSTIRGLVVNRFDNDGISTALNGGNVIEGNFIGTDIAGTAGLANGAAGVRLDDPSGNTIGGTAVAARNVISGNAFAGIRILESNGNEIQGNYIGTDVTGTLGLGNAVNGVRIRDASGNTVGGTAAGARNVISANGSNGVRVRSASLPPATTSLNLIQGNYIGTDVNGTADLGNVLIGVEIWDAASNTIGGTAAGARNVISGNDSDGVLIYSQNSPALDTTLNVVQGNFIGTDFNGTADLGNSESGVEIRDAASNTVGGTTAAARNVLSGNDTNGVFLRSLNSLPAETTLNLVQGNYIGTDVSGTANLGNAQDGVAIWDAASNTIGGTTPGARNLISGNDGDGVQILGVSFPAADTTLNLVQRNYIGTDFSGTVALGNGQNGVELWDAASNTIGGTTIAARNLISGNDVTGVLIRGVNLPPADATLNLVQGNYIGTDVSGTMDLGNGQFGVEIWDARFNTIGGTMPGARNVISANGIDGVRIVSIFSPAADTTLNRVQGNYIGTDFTGTADLGNDAQGVQIRDASGNTVGGATAGARNVISANGQTGVFIFSVLSPPSDTSLNLVQGNYIGTDFTGNADLGNGTTGVEIRDALSNTVGGTIAGVRNVISGNGTRGVFIRGLESLSAETTLNLVQGNYIGTDVGGDADLGNALEGVRVQDAVGNTIGGGGAGAGNRIAGNGGAGIASDEIGGSATGNSFLRNIVFSNAGLGIDLGSDGVTPNDLLDLDGSPNNFQNFPIVTSSTIANDTSVSGTLHSTPGTMFRVELFTDTVCDSSGFGEGERFLGFVDVTTDASGDASFGGTFANTTPAGSFVTATATDPSGNTSEFSPCGAPYVISVVPADSAVDVPVGTNVTLTFSEALNPATVTALTVRLLEPDGTPVPVAVGLAPDGVTVTLDPYPPPSPSQLSTGTIYTVEVKGGVEDLIGAPSIFFTSLFRTVDAIPTGTPLALISEKSTLPGPPPAPSPGARAGSLGTSGANLGFSVTQAGDLDGDGRADFVGGAPGYSLTGADEVGVAAIYLGSELESERTEADLIFKGVQAYDRAGVAVASGFDFDGDGTNDILIGAEEVDRTQDPPIATGKGKVYLILFDPLDYDRDPVDGEPDYKDSPGMFVTLDEVGTTVTGYVFEGEAVGDQAGFALTGGGSLETGDAAGHDEIVIGAPGANANDGKAYVIFSSNTSLSGTDASPDPLSQVGGLIDGAAYTGSSAERLGHAVALPGDLTGTSGLDVVLGAPEADTSQTDAGKVYVLEGGSLASGSSGVSTAAAVEIRGDQTCEHLGFAVAGGGDNRANQGSTQVDLLIGAPDHDIGSGDLCDPENATGPDFGRVVQSSARLSAGTIDVAQVGVTIDGVIWQGSLSGGRLGWWAMRLGDVTGNTHQDVGLGAPFANSGTSGAGVVYLIEGKATDGTAIQDLGATIIVNEVGQTTAGAIFLGTQTDERAGLVLAAAGDIDGDSVLTGDDFTVGAPGWAGAGTVHQVLDTVLQEQGECTVLGCAVADLNTGARLFVPATSLAAGVVVKLAVTGLADPSACGMSVIEDTATKTLAGMADYRRVDSGCGSPTCDAPSFAIPLDIDVPTRDPVEYQLNDGESLDLRYCHSTFGWSKLSLPFSQTGTVKANTDIAERKSVEVLFDTEVIEAGADTLRLYGVFFADGDGDDARTTCDCDDADGTIWAPPGEAQDLLLSHEVGVGTTFQWTVPEFPGGETVLYDVVRRDDPVACRLDPSTCFVTDAACVEANSADETSTDTTDPLPGEIFFYVVSPENACLSDPACLTPAGSRPAVDCTGS